MREVSCVAAQAHTLSSLQFFENDYAALKPEEVENQADGENLAWASISAGSLADTPCLAQCTPSCALLQREADATFCASTRTTT